MSDCGLNEENRMIDAFAEGESVDEYPQPDMGEVSDGYHTFNELYAHRRALFLALMQEHPKISWFSPSHHDGTAIEGYFIAGMHLSTGQISYHLPAEDWGFACKTRAQALKKAPEWDGHMPADVIKRLLDWIGT